MLLELTRRAIGAPLAVLAGIGLLYALFGDSLPWIFRHAGYSLSSVSQTVWFSLDGVFGLAQAVGVLVDGFGKRCEFHAQRDRNGILQLGPAHLQHVQKKRLPRSAKAALSRACSRRSGAQACGVARRRAVG